MATTKRSWRTQKPPPGTLLNSGHSLSQGLVGSWLFGEAAGALNLDSSFYQNSGRQTNCAWGVSPLGPALKFNGTSSLVDCGTGSSLANLVNTSGGPRPITWEFWINPTVNTSGTIIARNDGNTVNAGWWIALSAGPILQVAFERATQNTRLNYPAIGTGVWTHVVVTCSDTSLVTPAAGFTVYYNGVPQTQSIFSPGNGISGDDSTFHLNLGRYGNATGGGNGFYNGLLAKLSIYRRALSQTQAQQLYLLPYQMMHQLTRLHLVPTTGITPRFFRRTLYGRSGKRGVNE